MARHCKVILGEPVNGDNESGAKLAKDVYDTISDKTIVATASCQFGQKLAVLLIYDDVE
jgi:hypothetical protein